MPDYMSKRSKEEKDKSARAVAKTIFSTTPTHGKPGSWGDKEPGTFEETVLEPELEIVAVVEEEAIPEMIKEVLEETVVEAEPEPSGPTQTGALYNAYVGLKEAEIEALKAKLAELEK